MEREKSEISDRSDAESGFQEPRRKKVKVAKLRSERKAKQQLEWQMGERSLWNSEDELEDENEDELLVQTISEQTGNSKMTISDGNGEHRLSHNIMSALIFR